MLTFGDRAQIAVGLKQGLSDAVIGELIGRDRSVVWRERGRNSTRTRGYRPVSADVRAERRRARRQIRRVDADPVLRARVVKDLSRSRTPRQVAGRLRLEAGDPSVGVMANSLPADGATVRGPMVIALCFCGPDSRPRQRHEREANENERDARGELTSGDQDRHTQVDSSRREANQDLQTPVQGDRPRPSDGRSTPRSARSRQDAQPLRDVPNL